MLADFVDEEMTLPPYLTFGVKGVIKNRLEVLKELYHRSTGTFI